MIIAVTVLLCGGTVTAAVIGYQMVRDRVSEAVEPITEPTLPEPGGNPAEPGWPTGLPSDLPGLPTDLPNLPDGNGQPYEVVYEVTGDGPAEIIYTEDVSQTPKRVREVDLPWKVTTTMQGPSMVSVTAIRSGVDSGTIKCRATVDGEEVAQKTREGTFATVSCLKFIVE
ncbi:MmpS family transport accessory protein [Mangrovihabitans endophyticus]|uniref:MmpS family transport accessory protein n=1 Tax=Mangrovihabitans endophyticus TaxID=1751298 RepID=UPI00166314B6|nr:MmpS family transport accessory protein [Mangrovihabitans endophyticus]